MVRSRQSHIDDPQAAIRAGRPYRAQGERGLHRSAVGAVFFKSLPCFQRVRQGLVKVTESSRGLAGATATVNLTETRRRGAREPNPAVGVLVAVRDGTVRRALETHSHARKPYILCACSDRRCDRRGAIGVRWRRLYRDERRSPLYMARCCNSGYRRRGGPRASSVAWRVSCSTFAERAEHRTQVWSFGAAKLSRSARS